MRLINGNQAMAKFIAAATVISSTSQLFVSARIGSAGGGGSGKESSSTSSTSSTTLTTKQHQRRAPIRKGFDPTAEQQPRRRSSSYLNDHHYDRPASKSVDDTLKIQSHQYHQVKVDNEGRIRNATNTTTSSSNNNNNNNNNNNETEPTENNGCYNSLDTGVLICPTSPSSTPTIAAATTSTSTSTNTDTSKPKTTGKRNRTPKTTPIAAAAATAATPTTSTTTSTTTTTPTHNGGCMIGYYGDFGETTVPMPASDYLKEHVSRAHEEFGIVFDSSSNTVSCNQNYDVDTGDYSCAFLTFKGCNVICNGKESCFDSIIEDSSKIECNGYQSCYGAHLDADIISCSEEESCQSSIIGDKQLVSTLDCHAENSCSWSKTYQVNDVSCIGPFACFGAQLSGVESKVTCQSTPHPDGYYMAVCGGEGAFIEASENNSIDVTCSGDFSCIGYGHDAYDHKEHPIYFDIDVGRKGELICGNSLEGNHDGGTYVCRYIDIIQGCANYVCNEPLGFTDEDDYRTCNHIFSVHHHELCYEGPSDNDVDDDDSITDTASIKVSARAERKEI